MERAIKSYDPDLPEDPITKTFDAIQNQVHTSLLDNAPKWYLVGCVIQKIYLYKYFHCWKNFSCRHKKADFLTLFE